MNSDINFRRVFCSHCTHITGFVFLFVVQLAHKKLELSFDSDRHDSRLWVVEISSRAVYDVARGFPGNEQFGRYKLLILYTPFFNRESFAQMTGYQSFQWNIVATRFLRISFVKDY